MKLTCSLIKCMLLIILFTTCKSSSKNENVNNSLKFQNDSEVRRDKEKGSTDTLSKLDFYSSLAIELLKSKQRKTFFDTFILINGHNSLIRFNQGRIFSELKENAIVEIHDNNLNPFLYFVKSDRWKLKQVLYGYGAEEDSSYNLFDYNFDGYKDLAIFWNYSSGRCSCSEPGCRYLYLYNCTNDSLIEVPDISFYLDMGISVSEKTIYLGKHCDGYYARFNWKNYQLQLLEEYIARDEPKQLGQNQIYLNYVHIDGKNILRKCQVNKLPKKWEKYFHLNK